MIVGRCVVKSSTRNRSSDLGGRQGLMQVLFFGWYITRLGFVKGKLRIILIGKEVGGRDYQSERGTTRPPKLARLGFEPSSSDILSWF